MEDFFAASHTLDLFMMKKAYIGPFLSVPKDKVELHHLFLSDHVMSFFRI